MNGHDAWSAFQAEDLDPPEEDQACVDFVRAILTNQLDSLPELQSSAEQRTWMRATLYALSLIHI